MNLRNIRNETIPILYSTFIIEKLRATANIFSKRKIMSITNFDNVVSKIYPPNNGGLL